MKYNNLSEDDIDLFECFYGARLIWQDLLGEQKADELYDEMDRFYSKLWNE